MLLTLCDNHISAVHVSHPTGQATIKKVALGRPIRDGKVFFGAEVALTFTTADVTTVGIDLYLQTGNGKRARVLRAAGSAAGCGLQA